VPEAQWTLNFTSGSARLTYIGKEKLDEVVVRMKEEPGFRAQVLGYRSDAEPARKQAWKSNDTMGEQRAQAVKTYLVGARGIDPRRVTTEDGGSEPTGNAANDSRAVVILSAR
jgi:outer membrane protein OmpA-like peptidoglycan-associated protein